MSEIKILSQNIQPNVIIWFSFFVSQVKINGVNSNMPLSTEGVVNHCISEATDIDKLASMYIGWGAYL